MRKKVSIEKQIQKLRDKSHALFMGSNPNKWHMMDTIRDKTIALWAAWHRATK